MCPRVVQTALHRGWLAAGSNSPKTGEGVWGENSHGGVSLSVLYVRAGGDGKVVGLEQASLHVSRVLKALSKLPKRRHGARPPGRALAYRP